MLRSMTGYGQAVRMVSGYRVQIDLKSVNHRYGEVAIRMPREWLMFEDGLRKLVQQVVKRGRVDVFVTAERDPHAAVQARVNWALAESYSQAAEQLREKLGLPPDDKLQLKDLLSLPDVLTEAGDELEATDSLRQQLNDCLREALAELMAMREAEGLSLYKELSSRIHIVKDLRERVAAEAPKAAEYMRQRLRTRIQEMIADQSQFDEQRFIMEAAILAERADIEEELTRLHSHCGQFLELLEANEPVGRKLDFLIQEMNREVNTIGSKGNYTAITNLVVDLKAELEKLREQVQNIE